MMEGNRGSSVFPGEIIKFWGNAALIVPAEVAAPSKRGPSAFILASLIETELNLFYLLPLFSSGWWEIRKAKWTEIAFTAVQYVSGNELVSLDQAAIPSLFT